MGKLTQISAQNLLNSMENLFERKRPTGNEDGNAGGIYSGHKFNELRVFSNWQQICGQNNSDKHVDLST